MDKDQLGLAIQGLGIYSQELSPQYQALRERLAGSMAVNGMMLDEMRFQRESIRPNQELINRFVDLLPHAWRNGFTVKNAFAARMLESNVVWAPTRRFVENKWVNADNYGNRGHDEAIYTTELAPYYLIGEAPHPDRPNYTALLLTPVSGSRDFSDRRTERDWPVEISFIRTDEKEVMEGIIEQRAVQPYSEDEIKRMFNGHFLDLNIDDVKGFVHRDFKHPSKRKLVETIARVGGVHLTVPQPLDGSLTNDRMAQLNVLDRLNRLALAFGKVEELEALLKDQQAKAPENPLDKYFEPETKDSEPN